MPAGRPRRKWTEKDEIAICKKLATSNKSLKTVCKELKIDIGKVLEKLAENGNFTLQYARAKQDQADYLAEEIIEIADDISNDTIIDPETGKAKENKEWVNRSRLRVDARKWVAAKLKPKKYSDKIDVSHSGEIEVKQITGMEIK